MDKFWKIILPSGHTAFENHVSTINPLSIRLTYLMRDTFGFGDNVITEELATTDVVVVLKNLIYPTKRLSAHFNGNGMNTLLSLANLIFYPILLSYWLAPNLIYR